MLNSEECKEISCYLRNKMQPAYFQSDFEKLKNWVDKLDNQANVFEKMSENFYKISEELKDKEQVTEESLWII